MEDRHVVQICTKNTIMYSMQFKMDMYNVHNAYWLPSLNRTERDLQLSLPTLQPMAPAVGERVGPQPTPDGRIQQRGHPTGRQVAALISHYGSYILNHKFCSLCTKLM